MTEQEKRENTIKGLECCTTAIGCYECPYAVGGKATNACNLLIDRDALALLKAQEPTTCGECKHYDTHAFKCRNSLSYHYCCKCDKTFGCNAGERR